MASAVSQRALLWRQRLEHYQERAVHFADQALDAINVIAPEYFVRQILRRRTILPLWIVTGRGGVERGLVQWRDSDGRWCSAEGTVISGQFHTNQLWRQP